MGSIRDDPATADLARTYVTETAESLTRLGALAAAHDSVTDMTVASEIAIVMADARSKHGELASGPSYEILGMLIAQLELLAGLLQLGASDWLS